MKTSEALQHAKDNLNCGKKKEHTLNTYICFAARNHSECAGYKVKKVIMKLLYPHITLEDWLSAQGINWRNKNGIRKYKKIQATRLAWLDHLIARYQKLGD